MILQFTDQTVASHEGKNIINVELDTLVTDIPMLIMMPAVISFKAELIEPGFIGKIKLALRWLQDQCTLARGSVPLPSQLTSE